MQRNIPATISSSQAQSSQDKRFDVEIDPIAYALNGFSVHGGYTTGPWRIDLGTIGLEYPDALNSSDAVEASFVGAGWKLEHFIKGRPDGFFDVLSLLYLAIHIQDAELPTLF